LSLEELCNVKAFVYDMMISHRIVGDGGGWLMQELLRIINRRNNGILDMTLACV
jgi:hypothetical protein